MPLIFKNSLLSSHINTSFSWTLSSFNIKVFQPPSEQVTIPLLEIGYQTYLSRRNLTALTSVENSISITVFFFRSSQIITEISERMYEHNTKQATLKGSLYQSPDQAEMVLSLSGLKPPPPDSPAPSLPSVGTHSPSHTLTGALLSSDSPCLVLRQISSNPLSSY